MKPDLVTRLDTRSLGDRLVVLSPHLDDAVLSLGGTIARASRAGTEVTVVTVFAGDPESTAEAGEWDTMCGFSTAGEAARERRREDARACEILGAVPEWLPFPDIDYVRGERKDQIWPALARSLTGADFVFVPGFPLEHPDHAWLMCLVLEHVPATMALGLGLYVEQPYADMRVLGRGYSLDTLGLTLRIALRRPGARRLQQPTLDGTVPESVASRLDWIAAPVGRSERSAKNEALRAYSSQLPQFSNRLLPRLRLYEWCWGGEGVGLVRSPAHRRDLVSSSDHDSDPTN
jgi:LmbE family N-acetylglucosaminyl deacetylase